MPAGAIQPTTTPASNPFILRVGGSVHTGRVPVGDAEGATQVSITESADGANRLTFTIEDPTVGVTVPDGGTLAELVDRRSGSERLLFGGRIVETTVKPRPNGIGRFIVCTALGFDVWLDWRIVRPRWSSRTNKNGRISQITSDRAMVQQLVSMYGGGDLLAPDSTVENTTNAMGVISVGPVTLREAFDRIADAATIDDTVSRPKFYVDNVGRLHWYSDAEDSTPPYRVADGNYTRDVLATSGLVSYWPVREAGTGATEYDSMGYANGTYNGSVTSESTKAGIPNEPQHWVPWRFDGSDAYISATGANLHPGDTFTVEFWVRRHTTGSAQTVWSGGTDDVEIGFNASDNLIVYKEGTGNHFVSDATYTSTTSFIHVMVTREPGDTDVYVNGSVITGTTTARTFSAGSGTINIGRRKSGTDRYYSGRIASVAVYSTKKAASVALAHYQQGWSVAPEGLEFNRSFFDGREAVYIKGGLRPGSGIYRLPADDNSGFGRNMQLERLEVIDRPDSETAAQRRVYGRGFLRQHRDPERWGRFSVTGFDGWRVGQTVPITSGAIGITSFDGEIKEIETEVGFGLGVLTHTIYFGRTRRSGARDQARRRRGR